MDFNGSMAGYGGLIGSGLGNLFSDWRNPAEAGMPYLDQLRQQLPGYYQDYISRGGRLGQGAEGQFDMLMNDPSGRLNQIGQGYKQSPGFQFALQQALQGGNHAAAAGGMAGSPQHEQQNMQLASNLASQDYDNYMKNALGLYGQGLQGAQNFYGIGAQSSNSLANLMSQLQASQAQLAYQGQNAANQHSGGIWGSLFGGAGGLLGGLL